MSRRPPALAWQDLRALGAATADPVVGARQWRALMAAVAFDEIDEAAQRIMPAIFANLRDQPDLPERDRMRGAFKFHWSRTTELLHGVRPVLADLAAEGVDHRLLKGAAVQVVCGRIGARAMGDVDLLVSAADADRVSELLVRNGFRRSRVAVCAGHSDAEHHAALTFNSGDVHVDVHLAEFKEPVRLLSMMLAAPARRVRAAGTVLALPPAELLLLHAAVHGRLASGPTDFAQAVVDVAMLTAHVDPTRLVAAAARTGTTADLVDLDAAARAAGAAPLGVTVPVGARVAARLDALAGTAAKAAIASSSVTRRMRDRQRGPAATAAVAHGFGGDRRAYAAWLRSGQFAVAERAAVRVRGGFLHEPSGVLALGASVRPFAGATVPGLVASSVAGDTLDWRFRVRLPGPSRWLRMTLDAPSLDRLDVVVFRNGVPLTHVFAGDAASRVVTMRDVPAGNEFSLRALWRVCRRCYAGLDDLAVRFDADDDAR